MTTIVASTGALLVILMAGCSPAVQEAHEALDAAVAASGQGDDEVLVDASSSHATRDGGIVPPADVGPRVDVASSIDSAGADAVPTFGADPTGVPAVLVTVTCFDECSASCLDVLRRGDEEIARLQTCGEGDTCTTTALGTTPSALFPGSCCGLVHRSGANLSTVEALAGESADACHHQSRSCSCDGSPPPVVCRAGKCQRAP